MSYIGNGPPLLAQYGVESFDGGGTSFTLSKPATTATVLVFIDGVRQTPTDAYSVSGVTLTTTATTPSGTDNVTVQFLGDVVDFGEPSDDSVSTAKIQDDAVTADKLANSINTEIAANTAKVTNATHTGDVTGATALTIASGAVDLAMLSATGTASSSTFLRGDNAWEAAGGDNTPSFAAHRTTSQAIANDTATKVQCDVVLWDTDSAYDNTTNFRFTVPVGGAGKYCITWMASMVYIDDGNGTWALIYKNGSSVGQGPYIFYGANTNQGPSLSSTWILDLADSDYLELYIFHNEGSTENLLDNDAFFSAYKLIGV